VDYFNQYSLETSSIKTKTHYQDHSKSTLIQSLSLQSDNQMNQKIIEKLVQGRPIQQDMYLDAQDSEVSSVSCSSHHSSHHDIEPLAGDDNIRQANSYVGQSLASDFRIAVPHLEHRTASEEIVESFRKKKS
jgi:hypothetical protein